MQSKHCCPRVERCPGDKLELDSQEAPEKYPQKLKLNELRERDDVDDEQEPNDPLELTQFAVLSQLVVQTGSLPTSHWQMWTQAATAVAAVKPLFPPPPPPHEKTPMVVPAAATSAKPTSHNVPRFNP